MTQPFDNRDWDARQLELKDEEIARLKAERDHWEQECKIAYKAFDESNGEEVLRANASSGHRGAQSFDA